MSDQWNFYRLRVDGEPASIFLDMGIAESAPISGYDRMAYIRVRMLHPRDDGLSSDDEFDDLVALEDAIVEKTTAEATAIYVGRNTSSGNRDLYFYTIDYKAFETASTSAMMPFPAYSFEIGARPDAEWKTYFEFLYPSPKSQQQIANRSVREALLSHGDHTNELRQIDHRVIFPNAADCDRFVNFILERGFIINDRFADGGKFHLDFSKIDTPADIDDVTMLLFEAALEYGGDYDGWGCEVVN